MTPWYRMPDPEWAAASALRDAVEAAQCAAQLLRWSATEAERRVLAEAVAVLLDRTAANMTN